MSQLGQYKTPRELQDEDIWFRFFRKKQLLIGIATLILDWNIVTFSNKIHMTVIGVTLAVLITIIVGILAFLSMPKNKHLYGGGMELDKLAIRIFKRKVLKGSRIVYTKTDGEEDGGSF